MADVTVKYKGNTIAEMSAAGTKTLNTSGAYCEGDIEVSYAPNAPTVPNFRTYEITLEKSGGWVLLTTLDADVLEHINDASLVVTLVNMSPYGYEWYAGDAYIVTNRILGYSSASLPSYGMSNREQSETNVAAGQIRAPANNTDESASENNAFGLFRITDGKYYIKPGDGFIKAGTYRLTFTW